MPNVVQIIGIEGMSTVKAGDNVAALICAAAAKQGTPIQENDIVVVTHVIVSRAEGNVVNLDAVVPSDFARTIAQENDKDPALIETVLRESTSVRRMGEGRLITETKHGFVCANSGIDKSNVPGERTVALLPENADVSAQRIRQEIYRLTGCQVAIIVSDTHGRPLREGEINVAIGVAGIAPIRDRRGEKDLFGYVLKIKRTAIADELSSAAELTMGQADEGVPAALIRGYIYPRSEHPTAKELIRPKEKDLFS